MHKRGGVKRKVSLNSLIIIFISASVSQATKRLGAALYQWKVRFEDGTVNQLGGAVPKKLGKRFCKHYNRPPPPFTALLFLSVLRFLWQLILTDVLAQYPKNEILGIGLTSNFVWSNPFSLRLCVCLWAEKKYKFGQISRLICSLSRWSAAAADHKVNWHWRTPVAIALQKIVIWHRGRKKRWFCFGSTRWRCTLAEIFLFHFVRGQLSG